MQKTEGHDTEVPQNEAKDASITSTVKLDNDRSDTHQT